MNRDVRSNMMKTLLKGLAIAPLLICYILIACAIGILPVGGKSRRAMRIRNTSFTARTMLALFAIRTHVQHHERLQNHQGGRLVVSNHLSYTDVLIIASLIPSVFITSEELKHTMVLGMLARLGGSLFVERRKPSGLKRELAEISCVLDQGFSVVLFPEGTTSNGDRVQQFKNSLFDSAVSAGTDILPLCLRYTKVNSEAVTPQNRDSLFYHGDVTFFEHFPRFISLKSVDVDVIPLKAIKMHAHASRKELAAQAHSAISSAYHG